MIFFICTEPTLTALLNALYPVRDSWYNIGLQLGIPHTTLDCFRQNYSNQSDLLREMLKHWLDTAVDPCPTWEAVIAALRLPIIGKKKVAKQLEAKYCVTVQHQSNRPTANMEIDGGTTNLLFYN